MRLLNTETLGLEFFEGGPKLSYAILSHTWGDDEVSFNDLVTGLAPARKAWPKIRSCCAKARTEGYSYVWIDTCCIDKSSSAELSEAINSMFRWYQDAEVCYAYLADVDVAPHSARKDGSAEAVPSLPEALEESRWFTRGWTLQELLAPPDVVFFSRTWTEIGTRDSMAFFISATTQIDFNVLKQSKSLSSCSVAQRLSWAARRQTTKVEDEAYCLMGLFGVSMPLLYGEGHKAFKRLQLEIMKECYDPSILAWASADSYANIVGVLATSPAAFEGCDSIDWAPGAGGLEHREYGTSRACHDIIGSSLRLETPVISLGEQGIDIKLRAYDEEKPVAGPNESSPRPDPLQSLIHFPRTVMQAFSPESFEFSFLRHKKYSLILALLSGCREGGHTVGITLCRDSTGLLKRVHYPTRFLLPDASTDSDVFKVETLHVSLSGNEVLQKPLVPAWTRCMVRIVGLTGSPYVFSHTVPAMAPDAENCWYLNRWSEALDRVTLTTQPCFSLHQTKVARAIVFRHRTEPELSFRLVFSIWSPAAQGLAMGRPLNLCVRADVGGDVLEPIEGKDLLRIPDRQVPSPRRHFTIHDRYRVVVKFRKSQQYYTLAIVQISEKEGSPGPGQDVPAT